MRTSGPFSCTCSQCHLSGIESTTPIRPLGVADAVAFMAWVSSTAPNGERIQDGQKDGPPSYKGFAGSASAVAQSDLEPHIQAYEQG